MAFKFRRTAKKMMNASWRAKNKYIKYYDKLTIDDKAILLESQHGKEFNGNIFSIVQYLSKSTKYSDYKIYLSCIKPSFELFRDKLDAYNIPNVEIVEFCSDKYMRVLASAKYLINDNTFMPFYQKKDGQIYLNTWHGTPLKSLGRKIKNDAANIGNTQKNFLVCDYLLFPNEYTKEHMIDDYMLADISKNKFIYGGYPRNCIFFDAARRKELRSSLNLNDVKVYAYMPTYRGVARSGKTIKNDAYLLYHLYELDSQLQEDEVLYVNLHPIAKSTVDFNDFEHIREFPSEYETYDFLNIADALVTDYSSVFFDFACTKKKIVLFTYDKEDYLRDRGTYLSLDSLPYPQVSSATELLNELRSEKHYDDTEFLTNFCRYEHVNATSQLCDFFIQNEKTGLSVHNMPNNGKENVLIYVGNLAPNGITASLRNLFNVIDLEKRNYYITFAQKKVRANAATLFTFPETIRYYPTAGDINLTIKERTIRKLFKEHFINASLYMKFCGHRVKQGLQRDVREANFDTVIQFSGYSAEVILRYSCFEGKKIIYVHNDMVQEIKVRANQRKDVLRYAYRTYDKVAVVTEDIIPSTKEFSKNTDNLQIAMNAIPHKMIYEKSKEEPKLDSYTISSMDPEEAMKFILADTVKFVSVGRFSPEKGHFRLVDAFTKFSKTHSDARLLIIGGSSYKKTYDKLLSYIHELHMEDKILLLKNVSNSQAIVKACDYFVLSSFYEGFGLVIAEADIAGKPIISTNIVGPRGFMKKNNGTLVEDSESGLYEGMKLLYEGKIKPMSVDYEAYNKEVSSQFENLLK